MDIDTTNPVDGADASAEHVAAAATEADPGSGSGAGEAEPPLGEDGKPLNSPEDEEIELDADLRLTVPKEQAERVREGWLRQADYARQTQALAEERRAFETERSALQQASGEELSAYAQATACGMQIDEMDRTAAGHGGWVAWARADPAAANEAHMARGELERGRNFSLGQLQHFRGQRLSAAQQDLARRVAQARAILDADKEIGGWNAGKAAEVLAGGVREYGFDRSEIEELSDARMVKALHDGLKWRAHLKSQRQAQRHVLAQQAQPALSVGARSAPAQGLDDRLGTDEWVRRRNAQVRKRA